MEEVVGRVVLVLVVVVVVVVVGEVGVGEGGWSLSEVREVGGLVLVWVVVSAVSWARSAVSSASACSSRVSWRGGAVVDGVEVGGSGAGGSLCGGGCVAWSSVACDELHHHPMVLYCLSLIDARLVVFS